MPTCATGKNHRTTCQCWRHSRSEEKVMASIIGILVIGLIVGLLARFITPGPNPRGIIVTIVIGVVGAVIATYGGQALGLYGPGETASFIGSGRGAAGVVGRARVFCR